MIFIINERNMRRQWQRKKSSGGRRREEEGYQRGSRAMSQTNYWPSVELHPKNSLAVQHDAVAAC